MNAIVRPATAADRPALVAIMGDDPGDEQIGICGSRRRAVLVRRKLNDILFAPESLARTAVLVDGGDTVGLIQLGHEAGGSISFELAWMALRIFGPIGIFGLLRRQGSRNRVDFESPPDALHIAEVHVRQDVRGKGYGERLMRYAEEQAAAQQRPRLSLTTTTANPARHLYERLGYTVAQRKTDPDYQRFTGIEGRILMIKDIARSAT